MSLEVAAIILAAGASTRMGQSKQRLPWKAGTLLNHAIGTARSSGVSSVTAVLGADEEENRNTISQEKVNIVSNPLWENGMGSSLKAGLRNVIQSSPKAKAILVMVCDQPLVTAEHLRSLITDLDKPGVKAVVSRYAGTTGVPAVFAASLFDSILNMDDAQGAKKIIQHLTEKELVEIDLKGGEIDLDTYDQYLKYKKDE